MMRAGIARRVAVAAAGLLLATLAGACGESSGPPALHILAGSELKDLEPMLPDLEKAAGTPIAFDYAGTIDGAAAIAGGDSHTLAWFSSNRYLSLLPGASSRILAQKPVMLSPVVIGVKRSTAQRFGWENNPSVTWRDIADKASARQFTFAMTDPSASNSGFSALVGVASAFAGTGSALTVKDINKTALKDLFAGQRLTAGSSGFLADAYVGQQASVDGIINYESVLLSLNAGGRLHEPLDLVYPKDGIVTADYPLMLLNASQRTVYDKLIAYLTRPDVQTRIMSQTGRRPTAPEVKLDSRFTSQVLIEVPFPVSLDTVNTLIEVYLNEVRPPSHTFFVLDISGSMDGQRLDDLKRAFDNLTGADTSITGQFARFRSREQITVITFNGSVQDIRDFTINDPTPGSADLRAVKSFVDGLQANDGTAIYDALEAAYGKAGPASLNDPGRFYSVVLMTDGQSNTGASASDFQNWWGSAPPEIRAIKTFAVIFGEASPQELTGITRLTGGQVFDARSSNLATVFKQIRGYQ